MNNFHFVRLFASVMVLFSHSFYLYSKKSVDPIHKISGGIFTFGNIGVYIFLIVSGYLITQSIKNSSSIVIFFWRRLIRIFPALWIMILLSVFIFGPILTNQSLISYFSTNSNFEFLKNLFLFIPNNFKIPSVFNNNPVGTFNGCLWTIAYEFFFYMILALFSFLNVFKSRYFILIQWIVFVFIQFYLGERIYDYSYSSLWILNLNFEHCFRLFIYFEAGVLIFLYKENIFSNKKSIFIYIFFVLLSVCVLKKSNITLEIILPLLVIYFSIYNNKFYFLEKYGDFSYGLYLYGYIVQQFIVSLNLKFMNEYLLFILSLVVTLFLAYFSWHFIEKRALSLKYKLKNC